MEEIISRIANNNNFKKNQVKAAVDLLDDGNTIPFIARYRKEMTGNLDEEELRLIEERLDYIRKLNKRKDIEVVSTYLGAHAVPKEYKDKSEQYIDYIIKEVMPEVADKNLAEFCDVFCEEGVFNVEEFDPDPFMEKIGEFGLPWNEKENVDLEL